MKRKYIIISCLIIVFVSIFMSNNEDNSTRIRVIANSNDYSDIKVKSEVYDLITSNVNAYSTDKEIEEKLPELELLLQQFARRNNINIKCQFGITEFGPKELNGKVVPGGEYQTLLITIGEGLGSNYWTILYPEYYGIQFEEIYSGEVEIKSYFYELLKK